MSESLDIKVDLDTKDAVHGLLGLKDKIAQIGSEENLHGLIEGLMEVGAVAGVLGVAFFALKGTLEAVFETEDIMALNAQFEILTDNAHISGDALREGLAESSAGLIDNKTQLELANKAIVIMGKSAERIPELMELARKTTAVFGGELSDNFEKLTTAIGRGNTRLLKRVGINIDAKKALDEYAKAHGTTADALNATGKQQAILNAALEYGDTRMKGINPELKENQNTWARIKVELHEISELLTIIWAKASSNAVSGALKAIEKSLSTVKTELEATYGHGKEKTDAVVKSLENHIEKQKQAIHFYEEQHQKYGQNTDLEIRMAQKQLEQLEKKLALETAAQEKKMAHAGPAEAAPKSKEEEAQDIEDKQKRLERESKFAAEKLKINQALNKEMLDDTANEAEFQTQVKQRRLLEEQQLAVDIGKIRADTSFTQHEKDELIVLKTQEHTQKMKTLDDDLASHRQKSMEKTLAHSKSFNEGMSNAVKLSVAKQKHEINDFGKTGARVMASYQKNATNAFLAVGAGQKNVGEAMRDMAFGVIADEAQARGEVMLLESIWPPNPLGLAAGAGLVALAGALRSVGGGGGGSFSGGGGGGGAAAAEPITDTGVATAKEAPKKAVAINIGGNYYDNAQTRQELAQIVRDNLDATDFSIKRIGES